MINTVMKNFLLTLLLACALPAAAQQIVPRQATGPRHFGHDTIRVACVGNSITEGHGLKDKKTEAYPARLQELLGDRYLVQNFGLSGHTLMNGTDRPYMHDGKWFRFQKALASNPDIVTIKLGTNDSKTPYDSLLHADFMRDLNAMIDSFQALPSKPYIYLCLPIPANGEVWTIRDSVIEGEVIPRIRAVAQERNLPVIDLYKPFKPFMDLLPDKIHPNAAGAMLIAEEIARRIETDMLKGVIRFGNGPRGLRPRMVRPDQGKKMEAAPKEKPADDSSIKVEHKSRHQKGRRK